MKLRPKSLSSSGTAAVLENRSLKLTVDSLEDAARYCRRLAGSHYENFTVSLPLLNRDLRQDLANIYCYCRWVDDLADRPLAPPVILSDLAKFEKMLDAVFSGSPPPHPVFWALSETVQRRSLSIIPFRDLLSAFRQDQRQFRYRSFAELVDYSRRSAAPVGRLVLACFDQQTELNQYYADLTSIALQLVNFWADIPLDLKLGRIYLPEEDRDKFKVDEKQIKDGIVDQNFRQLMSFEIERTRDWLRVGWNLSSRLTFPLSLAVELFNAGGWKVLDKLAAADYDPFQRRWTLTGYDKLWLGFKGVCRCLAGISSPPTS